MQTLHIRVILCSWAGWSETPKIGFLARYIYIFTLLQVSGQCIWLVLGIILADVSLTKADSHGAAKGNFLTHQYKGCNFLHSPLVIEHRTHSPEVILVLWLTASHIWVARAKQASCLLHWLSAFKLRTLFNKHTFFRFLSGLLNQV